ncbi:MAG TPA: hypothetical protein VD978_35240 [Azospirillum sp.]|nr:hypothetical protein [Azospirillum sp.]
MKTIVALFDTPDDARATCRELVAAGINEADIEVVQHSGYGAGEGHGEVVPELMGWGVPQDEAIAYAEGLRRGYALLAISPGSEDAMARALSALESAAQVDVAARAEEWRATGWAGEPAAMPKPPDTDADRRLGDAADALRVTNTEVVPPPPSPGKASPSFAPGSADDIAEQRLDRTDPERRS